MTTLSFFVIVTNSAGLKSGGNIEVEITDSGEPLPPVVDSVSVSPPSGPVGTLFTITVDAHDANVPPLPITYNLRVSVNGGEQVLNTMPTEQPNVFTFIWQP